MGIRKFILGIKKSISLFQNPEIKLMIKRIDKDDNISTVLWLPL